MPWYLYFALKQIFPTRGRVSFFTAVSVGGVTLGVMLLIIVLSLMNGFGDEIRSRIVDTSGHLRVVQSGVLENAGSILARVRAQPEVEAAAPYTSGMALLQSEEKTAFPYLHGIDPALENSVVPLGRFLVAGRLDDLDDDAILLSSGLADRLEVRTGEQVDLFSPRSIRPGPATSISLPRSLRVAGIFHTGWNQVDENSAICTTRLAQELYVLGTGVNGIAVRLKPGIETDVVTARLNQLLPPAVRAVSWQDSNRDFLYVLQLEKNVMFFLLFFIEIVAAFAIAGSLLIVVTRRAREIGLLASLGARPREIAGIFCLQGLLVGAVGSALGVACAWLALHYRHGFLEVLARVSQNEAGLARFYQFSDIPASYSARDLVLVVAASLVISTLAGLLPAWRAARLKPAEALRRE
jgi:lipoprotein-releasing system permease protein